MVVRDADNNVRSASDNVKGAFEDAGLPVPIEPCIWQSNQTPKTGFILMPTAESGAFDWNSPKLYSLRDFLLELSVT